MLADEPDPSVPTTTPAPRGMSPRLAVWLVCVVAVIGLLGYQTLTPSHEERVAEREADLRAKAVAECDRMAALYDEGKDQNQLRAAHRDRYGEGHTVLFKMRTICPNLREVLSSDRGTSSTTGSSSLGSGSTAPSSPPPSAETSEGSRLEEEADRLAEFYGYTLPSSPAGEGAALAELTCDRAATGWDYETAVADDIDVGAPQEAAVGWNSFVYEEFCPAMQ